MTPLCYAYLAGSLVLFAIWLVFFLLLKDLRQEMLTMSVLIGVLSVVTGYVWWTVDWWKPPTITRTIVGVEDLVMGFAAGGIMAGAYEVLFRRHLYHMRTKCLSKWPVCKDSVIRQNFGQCKLSGTPIVLESQPTDSLRPAIVQEFVQD
jgi:hypothetical protein